MKARIAALWLVVVLLASFAPFSKGEEETKRIMLRDIIPASALAYLEMPRVDLFLKDAATTAPAVFFEQLEELDAFAGGSKKYVEFVRKAVEFQWGIAYGYSSEYSSCFAIVEEKGRARELWKTILALDPAAEKEMKPVEGQDDTFTLGECRIIVADDKILLSWTEAGFKEMQDGKAAKIGKVITAAGGSNAPDNGYFLFFNMEKTKSEELFDGWELPLAKALGIDRLGTIIWSGGINSGRFYDNVRLRPSSKGWKGLAKAGLKPRPIRFDGRLAKQSLFRFALSLPPKEAFSAIKSTFSKEMRKKIGTAELLYETMFRRKLVHDIKKAYTGQGELTVQLPELGFIPHFSFSVKASDIPLARKLFEYANSGLLPVFPRSSNVKGNMIYYSNPIKGLGLTPCAMFSDDALLISDSIPYIRSLVKKDPSLAPDFKSPDTWTFPGEGSAAFYADDKQCIKWMLAAIPLLPTIGLKLPIDPVLLPMPDEAAEPFTITVAKLSAEQGDYILKWESDIPLLSAASAFWMSGRIVGFW